MPWASAPSVKISCAESSREIFVAVVAVGIDAIPGGVEGAPLLLPRGPAGGRGDLVRQLMPSLLVITPVLGGSLRSMLGGAVGVVAWILSGTIFSRLGAGQSCSRSRLWAANTWACWLLAAAQEDMRALRPWGIRRWRRLWRWWYLRHVVMANVNHIVRYLLMTERQVWRASCRNFAGDRARRPRVPCRTLRWDKGCGQTAASL